MDTGGGTLEDIRENNKNSQSQSAHFEYMSVSIPPIVRAQREVRKIQNNNNIVGPKG